MGRRGRAAAGSPQLLRGGAGDGGGTSRSPFSFLQQQTGSASRSAARPLPPGLTPRMRSSWPRVPEGSGPSGPGAPAEPRLRLSPRPPGEGGTGARSWVRRFSVPPPRVMLPRLGCRAASAPPVSPGAPHGGPARRCGRGGEVALDVATRARDLRMWRPQGRRCPLSPCGTPSTLGCHFPGETTGSHVLPLCAAACCHAPAPCPDAEPPPHLSACWPLLIRALRVKDATSRAQGARNFHLSFGRPGRRSSHGSGSPTSKQNIAH